MAVYRTLHATYLAREAIYTQSTYRTLQPPSQVFASSLRYCWNLPRWVLSPSAHQVWTISAHPTQYQTVSERESASETKRDLRWEEVSCGIV